MKVTTAATWLCLSSWRCGGGHGGSRAGAGDASDTSGDADVDAS